MKNIKAVKFIITGVFLFFLAYINKDRIPMPTELKTYNFIISSGIDISLDSKNNSGSDFENEESKDFSISYISSEETGSENDKSNENKNIYNVKSSTLNSAISQLQNLTNKNLKDSHLEYILIGEETAKENLGYFIKHYSKSPSIRFDVNTFITKDMTSEKFIEKILTSEIDVDARISGLLNNKTQMSSMTKKNLKDLLQIFYSENKVGLIPTLEIVESPVKDIKGEDKNSGNKSDEDSAEVLAALEPEDENQYDLYNSEEADNFNKTEEDKESKKYTFGFYGLGIIKDGKLVDYLENSLVRSYIILTKNLKATDIKIIDENSSLATFAVKSSNCKISFEFDKYSENPNIPLKIIFDINIDTNLDETMSDKKILTDENIPNLNALQNEVIKSEIEKIIEKSKSTGADFLNLGGTFAIQHPYKWHAIEKDWDNIFKNLEYEINISTKIKRYYNINSYDAVNQ